MVHLIMAYIPQVLEYCNGVLKGEIVTQATNTSQAFEQSRLQEMSLEALFKSKRNPFKNLTSDLSTDSNHTSTNPFFKNTSIIPPVPTFPNQPILPKTNNRTRKFSHHDSRKSQPLCVGLKSFSNHVYWLKVKTCESVC